uniref:Expansin-like CBD domain-containing protein n=1 Tax=Oryza brachyantha TaxID=4533 RepID=J3MGK0_ORYBR
MASLSSSLLLTAAVLATLLAVGSCGTGLTFTLESKAPLNGPFSVRFLVKNGGYRVIDDVIPEEFKAGSVYKTSIQI